MSSDLSLGGYKFKDLFEAFLKGEFRTRQEVIDSSIELAKQCGVELTFNYTNFGKAIVGNSYVAYFGNVDEPEKFLWVLATLMIGNLHLYKPRSVLPSLNDLEYFVKRIPIYIASERGKEYLMTASQVIMIRLDIPWNTPDFIRQARGERFSRMYPERDTEHPESVSTGNKKRSTRAPMSRVEKLKTS